MTLRSSGTARAYRARCQACAPAAFAVGPAAAGCAAAPSPRALEHPQQPKLLVFDLRVVAERNSHPGALGLEVGLVRGPPVRQRAVAFAFGLGELRAGIREPP